MTTGLFKLVMGDGLPANGDQVNFTKFSEKIMSMDEATWASHSNPLSVYSRFTVLPILSLAIWSREWMGVYAVVPIVLSLVWVWLNPRAFGAPAQTNNWASMGTFGERIYLRKTSITIPKHHLQMAKLLQLLAGIGLPILCYGLYCLNIWAVVMGNLIIIVFKAWFVDRMVWLYLDVKDSSEEFQNWLKL